MRGWDQLASKVAIVTGASSGIGASIAERFGRARMRVALTARRADLLEQVAAQVRAGGGETLVVPADMRDPTAIASVVKSTQATWGRIDVLVANAGVGRQGSVTEISEDALREIVDVNLLGLIFCARAVLPVMRTQQRGAIIAIASVAGEVTGPTAAIYGATKAGMLAFCEGLGRSVASEGIAVSAILPGFIDTSMRATRPVSSSWRGAPPTVVAEAVISLLHHPRREVVVPAWYRIPIGLNRWAPAVLDWVFAWYRARTSRQPKVR